ncbi:MAG TPA: YjjG family noncanonical pyrimidine nucleotidase [Bacteroidia bacterium]|nr:YjjG family noncanonical pyrimidine nucleotidase [Bacteroidia bacterium]HNU34227.1 YjjG family noncanonical pyrimidine nucleotidase [Bacteroidia bacterium]
MKKKYTHLFFDLDHTLWDTDSNARHTMEQMFSMYKLEERGIADKNQFIETYNGINHSLWSDYSKGKIGKEFLRNGRFTLTLKEYGIDDDNLVKLMSDYFVEHTPSQTKLIDDASELLNYLHPKYELYIITNGFKEAQHRKLKSSDIHHFFKDIFISEEIGYNKPDTQLFAHIIKQLNVDQANCLMIGDNPEADIEGANSAGWDSVYFCPQNIFVSANATHKICRLIQLKDIL